MSSNRNPCDLAPWKDLNLIQSISSTDCCGMVQFVVSSVFCNGWNIGETIFQQSYPQICGSLASEPASGVRAIPEPLPPPPRGCSRNGWIARGQIGRAHV